MSGEKIESILRSNKVLICVGSGGVGKTTISASLGVRAAQMGLRVLVMTIDPSQRLKVALGIQRGISRVPNQHYSGELSAMILDAEEIFKEFIIKSSAHRDLADKLLTNRLYQQLSTTLSGSQEFTALLQLSKIANENEFDLIILDTPPAHHAVDFLEAPEKINALFNDSIVRWFLNEEEQSGIIQKIISRGTRTVFGALERITGSYFMHELSDFFASVRTVQNKIGETTEQVQKILKQDSTGFFLVTGFDEAKLNEAESLNSYLGGKGYHLVAAVINRAFPQWTQDHFAPEEQKLSAVYDQWQVFHAERERIYGQFSEKWSKKLPVVRIPDLNKDMDGLAGLEVIAHELDLAFDFYSHRLV